MPANPIRLKLDTQGEGRRALIWSGDRPGFDAAILALHRTLIGRGIDARVTCAACGTQNEFVVPVAEIATLKPPDPDAQVSLPVKGQTLAFRLPRYADLDGSGLHDPQTQIASACLMTPGPLPVLTESHLAHLAGAWEAVDPAGHITVSLTCVGCGATFDAAVDPALFVARDLDLFADSLLRDVNCIASRYGWSEAAILNLPSARRLRYVALIQSLGQLTPLREVLG